MAFIMLQKIIQINAVLLNFLLIKESCEKCKNGEHKHTFLCMIIDFLNCSVLCKRLYIKKINILFLLLKTMLRLTSPLHWYSLYHYTLPVSYDIRRTDSGSDRVQISC